MSSAPYFNPQDFNVCLIGELTREGMDHRFWLVSYSLLDASVLILPVASRRFHETTQEWPSRFLSNHMSVPGPAS